jgi:hypothetical protein
VVFVLAGTGAGQFARIVYMNTTVVTIYKPFPIPLDSTSIISVTAYLLPMLHCVLLYENNNLFYFFL